ncbi:MAG: hypothetical protein ACRC6C_02580 [Wolbachia pipientis]
MQLAISHPAKDTLPRNLEYLLGETYNWFARSSSRQSFYKEVYKTINDGHDPLKIVQSCDTRWLSIESAVSRILAQWTELKVHFKIARLKEKCYTAEMLYNMYCDGKNHAYLLFLKPILSDVQRVNKNFEAKNADSTKLLNDLLLLLEGLIRKVVIPTRKLDAVSSNIRDYLDPKPYLGYAFEEKIRELQNEGKICLIDEQNLRQRSVDFIISLVQQIRQRLPENINVNILLF